MREQWRSGRVKLVWRKAGDVLSSRGESHRAASVGGLCIGLN